MNSVARYLSRRAELVRRPFVSGNVDGVRHTIVIPALREFENLPATIASLAKNEGDIRSTLMIVVVNNRVNCTEETRENNRATLEWLERAMREYDAPRIAYVDASSVGNELGQKEGVGSARKIGMDWALEVLRRSEAPGGLIACLDADTTVDAGYIVALTAHFNAPDAWGAVLPFAHPLPENDERARGAIVWYETYLRYWVLALRYARSPYAYHSVGSAMACSPAAYVAVSGMNRRNAGEDFYFLQELAKTGHVDCIRGTTVHPSARVSDRVPFGTGRRMSELLASTADPGAYHPDAFEVLRAAIEVLRRNDDAGQLLNEANAVEPALADFLRAESIELVWPKLIRHARDSDSLQRQRMRWFDAFKTLKCMHTLRDHGYSDQPLLASVRTMLSRSSLAHEIQVDDREGLLTYLRTIA